MPHILNPLKMISITKWNEIYTFIWIDLNIFGHTHLCVGFLNDYSLCSLLLLLWLSTLVVLVVVSYIMHTRSAQLNNDVLRLNNSKSRWPINKFQTSWFFFYNNDIPFERCFMDGSLTYYPKPFQQRWRKTKEKMETTERKRKRKTKKI